MHDPAELPAGLVHDPDAAGSAAIDVPLDINLHTVRHARLGAAQIGKNPVGVLGEHAARQQVEGADVAAARVVDVKDALVGREGKPVRQYEIVDQQAQRAEIGRHPIDAGEGQIPLLRGGGAGPWIGEIDAAVGFDDDIVRPVQPAPLEAVGDNGDAAVELLTCHTAAVMLAGDEPPLQIAGQAVGAVGRFLEQRDAGAGLVLHAPVVVDIAEQEIAAFLPP